MNTEFMQERVHSWYNNKNDYVEKTVVKLGDTCMYDIEGGS